MKGNIQTGRSTRHGQEHRQADDERAAGGELGRRSTSSSSAAIWRPMSRKTEFSRRKDDARPVDPLGEPGRRDWSWGALWASSSPAVTTANTPEAPTCSAGTYARYGATNDSAVSGRHLGDVLAHQPDDEEGDDADRHTADEATPQVDDTEATVTRGSAGCATRGHDQPAAASAVRRVTRAVASLSRDSPSRIVVIRRGRPIRRATEVAATASGGATIAPRARARAKGIGSSSQATSPTPSAVNSTRPTERLRMATRLRLDVEQRGRQRGGVEQRGQQAVEHQVAGQAHLGHAGHERQHGADDEQGEGRRARRTGPSPC